MHHAQAHRRDQTKPHAAWLPSWIPPRSCEGP
jgi:hypothetical protein